MGGCYIERRYRVPVALAAELEAAPDVEQAGLTFAARREADGKPVTVRRDSLVRGASRRAGSEGTLGAEVVVTTRRYSALATTGVVLTSVGTVLSVIGSGLFFGTKGTSRTVGAVLAGAGEPFMISGTVAWILGMQRSPMETR